MRILVAYATTEGHTRKVARHAARHLASKGDLVELLNVADAEEADVGAHEAVVMAGSVHAGSYQSDLRALARAQRAELAARPTLFLSVSLSAAGEDARDLDDLEKCVERFKDETGWTPGKVVHVAGALRFSKYDFFRYWAMRFITAQRQGKGKVVEEDDIEFTDWDKLEADLDAWRASGSG